MKLADITSRINWPQPGSYVLAVSGGVDSMVLLDLMATAVGQRGYQLVVAHFDHGIRPDSASDAVSVETVAKRHGIAFATQRAELAGQSEVVARQARYRYLRKVMSKHAAQAILTAHHKDDARETIIFNTLRGTNIFGQTGFGVGDGDVLRPLAQLSKQDLTAYAAERHLEWHEDSTNADISYTRNFIRHEFLPFASHQLPGFDSRFDLLAAEITRAAADLREQVNNWLAGHARFQPLQASFDRAALTERSDLSRGYLIYEACHRLNPGLELKSVVVAEAARFAVAGRSGQKIDLGSGLRLYLSRDKVVVASTKD